MVIFKNFWLLYFNFLVLFLICCSLFFEESCSCFLEILKFYSPNYSGFLKSHFVCICVCCIYFLSSFQLFFKCLSIVIIQLYLRMKIWEVHVLRDYSLASCFFFKTVYWKSDYFSVLFFCSTLQLSGLF